jgi:GDP-D-mannose dehydratase
MSKAIIFGISGMDAKSLTHILLGKKYNVVGTYRRNTLNVKLEIHPLFNNDPLLTFDYCDVNDFTSVKELLSKNADADEIYLLAAQSNVGFSFQSPSVSAANGMSVFNVLENVKNICPKAKTYFAACYDEKTKVVTKNGIKDYTELKIGDKVWSLNPENSELEEAEIKRVFEYDYDDKMIHFTGLGKDFMVTPNHKVFYQNRKNDGLLSAEASKVNEMSDSTLPKVKKYIGKVLDDRIDLTQYLSTKSHKRKQIDSISSLDLCYLMGLYIGDGSCNIMNSFGKDDRGCARISYAIPEEDECFVRVRECLERNFIKWARSKTNVCFFSWGLYYFFDKCGHNAQLKEIPRDFLDLGVPFLSRILDGIVDTDGQIRYGKKIVYTSSKRLTENLIELGVKLGYNVSVRERPKKNGCIDGREIKCNHTPYVVYFNKTTPHIRRKTKTKWHNTEEKTGKLVDYKGKIWCFELEKNHNFLVERNGQVVFSGNTSELFGGKNPEVAYNEDSPYDCRSPYSVGKEMGTRWVKYYRQLGLFTCYGVLFNHSCQYRGLDFYIRRVTNSAARIYLGKQDKLTLGNLNFYRDEHWSDFSCEMMWKMLQREGPKDYVIATGKTWHGEQYLDEAFGYFNLRWQDYVEIDKTRFRPNEVEKLIGDSSLAQKELGWRPDRMPFKDHISLMCKYDYELESNTPLVRPDVFSLYP